jgi:arylsulfatase A-like enzyme
MTRALMAVLILALVLVEGVAAVPIERPNVLVILADDLDVTSYDLAMPRTRALIEARGLRFTQARVSSPLCCPSRASLLRGQYQHNHGVMHNRPELGGGHQVFRPLESATIATHLHARGYLTAWIGKYLNGYGLDAPKSGSLSVPPGWTTWAAFLSGVSEDYYYGYALNVNGRRTAPAGTSEDDYSTDRLADLVARTIRARKATPWFLVFAPYAPHFPAWPAPRHAGMFGDAALPRPPSFNEADVTDKPSLWAGEPLLTDKQIAFLETLHRRRLASLQAVDEAVERFVEALRDTRQLGRTFIVVTSDNGYHLGQHRFRFGKATAYAEDVVVPLVVRGPRVPHGEATSALALNVDLAPTFAKLAGTKPPRYMDGRSLVKVLRGEATLSRRVALVEMGDFRGLRTERYAYTEWTESGERELYDLAADPHEVQNLASVAPTCLLDGLTARLGAMSTCAGETCRTLEATPLDLCPWFAAPGAIPGRGIDASGS